LKVAMQTGIARKATSLWRAGAEAYALSLAAYYSMMGIAIMGMARVEMTAMTTQLTTTQSTPQLGAEQGIGRPKSLFRASLSW
jgi:hypothetical protein